MKIEIVGNPAFNVELELPVVNAIAIIAEHHYDHVCKSSMVIGGFLRRIQNTLHSSQLMGIEPGLTSMSFREIDTTMKICEMAPFEHRAGRITADNLIDIGNLCVQLSKAARIANEIYASNTWRTEL